MNYITNKPMFILFNLISTAGLIWQMYQVSLGYFQYEVMTTLSFNLSSSNEERVINVRFLYWEVINRTKYEMDKNVKLPVDNNSFDAYLSAENFTNSVTVDEILYYTPSVDMVTMLCDHWTVNSLIECNPKMNVKVEKYVVNLFIIYRFKFIPKETSSNFDELSLFYKPFNNYGVISFACMNAEYFNHANIIGFFLNSDNNLPFIENTLATTTDTDYDFVERKQRQLAFVLRPHLIKVYKLPPPYKTMCKENYNFYHCYANCVNDQTVEKLNRLAPLKFHKSGEQKQLTHDDILNVTKVSMYDSINTNCKKKCPDSECIKELVITHIERSAVSPLMFAQSLSDSPSFIVFSNAKNSFADYLALVMSCFGTWFGLSVISLNPFKFKKKVGKVDDVKFSEHVLKEKIHAKVVMDRIKKIEQYIYDHRRFR